MQFMSKWRKSSILGLTKVQVFQNLSNVFRQNYEHSKSNWNAIYHMLASEF